MTELAASRKRKDNDFKYDYSSPIPLADRESFNGLDYYPEQPDLRLVLPLEQPIDATPVTMDTSTGDPVSYTPIGVIRFPVDGQEGKLTVFESEDGDLFLPFRDATSGKETYGAGRYLEPERVGPDRLEVDFNLAYNPFCAYSDEWSCPLPPTENWLTVPIRAGEKKYHD